MNLPISTLKKEGIYQGSKWLKLQVLCDREELASLFKELSPFSIYPLTGIVDGKPTEQGNFLDEYGRWIEKIRQGSVPSDAELRGILAAAFVDDLESLWLQEVVGKGYLVKIAKPLIQVQAHYFTYSSEDKVFRPMSMGSSSIFWGLLFSYPQIYQDPKTMELKEAPKNGLFEKLRLWVREATRPTPFFIEGKKVNSSMRIGKKTISWIGCHPQLISQQIGIAYDS